MDKVARLGRVVARGGRAARARDEPCAAAGRGGTDRPRRMALSARRCRPCARLRLRGRWCRASSSASVGVHAVALAGADGCVGGHRQPLGSAPSPLPARTCVCAVMVIVPSCRRWEGLRAEGGGTAGVGGPCRHWVLRGRSSTAVRVQPRAFAGADVRVLRHLPPPCSGARGAVRIEGHSLCGARSGARLHLRSCRRDRLPGRYRRGQWSSRSSSAFVVSRGLSAVGIEACALAGADRGRRVHGDLPGHPQGWPHGSMVDLQPAWMLVLVFIAHLACGRPDLSRRDRSVGRCRPGWSRSSSSPPPQPHGSMQQPSPARTCVLVVIGASGVMRLPAVSRRRWGPSRRRRRRALGCSSSSPGLPLNPSGRCRRRRRRGCSSWSASRSPLQPFGSMPLPSAARTAVVVRIPASVAGVSRWGPIPRGRRRGRVCSWSSRSHPLGSTQPE